MIKTRYDERNFHQIIKGKFDISVFFYTLQWNPFNLLSLKCWQFKQILIKWKPCETIIKWRLNYNFIWAYPSKPSILQTTCASLMSQLSSQITPHSPLYWSSTLPEFSLSPSIRRIPKGGMVLPAKITDINRTRWKIIHPTFS